MTKLEILEETAAYYSEDTSRRAEIDGGCYYEISGRRCAVGRCMNEKADFEYRGGIFNYISSEFGINETLLDTHLLPQYHGHDIDFWSQLQFFHDNNDFWDKEGLTDLGKRFLKNLKEKYADN